MVDEKGQCLVKNFIVGREDYGEVKFLGVTDVKDLNLDKISKFIILEHHRIVQGVYQIRYLIEVREKSGNLVNVRGNQRNVKENVCFFSINRFPDTLKKLGRRHIMPIMKLLVFIFHDRNRAHFA